MTTLKTGNKAFTLIEVLAATAVLALGVTFVYEVFLVSLDTFNYCLNYFSAAHLVNELTWQAQESLTRFGKITQDPQGQYTLSGKSFKWEVRYDILDEEEGLYNVGLSLSWQQGKREYFLSRAAYAVHEIQ